MSEPRKPEELIHAYLDGELTEDDAEELLAALRAEPARGRELRELEAIVETARQLAPPPLPAGFTERALARVAARPQPSKGLLAVLLAPRLSLRLSALHGAAAMLGLSLLVAGAGLAGFLGARQEPAVAAVAKAEPGPPEGVRPVRFVLSAGDASRVELAGDFNGWAPAPLAKNADGTFELSLALSPGRHEYAFLVDGAWLPDPLAARVVEDGFGGRNSVLEL